MNEVLLEADRLEKQGNPLGRVLRIGSIRRYQWDLSRTPVTATATAAAGSAALGICNHTTDGATAMLRFRRETEDEE